MDTCANVDGEGTERVAKRARALNGAAGSIEGCEHAVAGGHGGPHDTSPVLFDDGSGDDIVAFQKCEPGAITLGGSTLSGTDDVSEQDGRKHSIDAGRAVACPREETFDLIE